MLLISWEGEMIHSIRIAIGIDNCVKQSKSEVVRQAVQQGDLRSLNMMWNMELNKDVH